MESLFTSETNLEYTVFFSVRTAFPPSVYSCLVFSLSTPGIIMSHLFLTLSLGSGRVLTCSEFDLALFLLRCLLFALLQAASMRTRDLTQLLCGFFWRLQRAGPVAKEPPKALNSIQKTAFHLYSTTQLFRCSRRTNPDSKSVGL